MVDKYRGWYRLPGGDWQQAAAGDTEDECWHRLRLHVAALGARFVDSCVCQTGSDPRRRGPRQAIRTPGQRRMF